MDFYFEKALKNKSIEGLKLNRCIGIGVSEAVETSVLLSDCSCRPNLIGDSYPNFQKLLQTYTRHTKIYPQHSRYNEENQKETSCILELIPLSSDVANFYLRVFLPEFDYTNFLILMGSSQVVTFSVSCFIPEDIEFRAEEILRMDERKELFKLEFSIDIVALNISFLG